MVAVLQDSSIAVGVDGLVVIRCELLWCVRKTVCTQDSVIEDYSCVLVRQAGYVCEYCFVLLTQLGICCALLGVLLVHVVGITPQDR